MHVDVAFTARSVNPSAVADRTAVIIDVLRASTTIAYSLEAGVQAVYPVLKVQEARDLKQKLQNEGQTVLLSGERHGIPPSGFDMGNSPQEVQQRALQGTSLVLTTSNGTRAALAAENAAARLVGCFANLNAVCQTILEKQHDVALVCAGTDLGRTFCLEDGLAAGFIIRQLLHHDDQLKLSEAAELVLRASEGVPASSSEVIALLRSLQHGQKLLKLGLADDVVLCGSLNAISVTPTFEAGAFVRG